MSWAWKRLLILLFLCQNFEDYVTWADDSKVRKHVMRYNDKLDDFDLLWVVNERLTCIWFVQKNITQKELSNQ